MNTTHFFSKISIVQYCHSSIFLYLLKSCVFIPACIQFSAISSHHRWQSYNIYSQYVLTECSIIFTWTLCFFTLYWCTLIYVKACQQALVPNGVSLFLMADSFHTLYVSNVSSKAIQLIIPFFLYHISHSMCSLHTCNCFTLLLSNCLFVCCIMYMK